MYVMDINFLNKKILQQINKKILSLKIFSNKLKSLVFKRSHIKKLRYQTSQQLVAFTILDSDIVIFEEISVHKKTLRHLDTCNQNINQFYLDTTNLGSKYGNY
ncbi:hypothetical protein BpHYR1_047102 [Brachionus plicatilis]|uniref:Uncharacterized protein n=1 Tax=Brachionus plicatilis TaxID=10195 RepID=A0A3M7Q180_BRAPC|nr:hypothetical protein BpHYR1_047102 [Brachionus plicatilis]